MSRKEDVVNNFMSIGMVQVIKSRHIKKIIRCAVGYGFEHGESFGKYGESFGKYGAFVEKQNDKLAEALIQPENDRVWREQLEAIQKDKETPDSQQTVKLLSLIAEMILYRRN